MWLQISLDERIKIEQKKLTENKSENDNYLTKNAMTEKKKY